MTYVVFCSNFILLKLNLPDQWSLADDKRSIISDASCNNRFHLKNYPGSTMLLNSVFRMPRSRVVKTAKGFTLIEVMITVAIIGILAAIAYPSYTQYVIRSNRSAAQAQMLDIANRQQQFLLANRAYATTAAMTASGYAVPTELSSKYAYSITVGSGTVPSFEITFTPSGSQASDGALTLNSDGVKAPAAKW